MFIGFFNYDDKICFFGYEGPLSVTKFTENLAEVRFDLAVKTGKTIDAQNTPFVQAFLRRKLVIDNNGVHKSMDYYPETIIVEFRPSEHEVLPFITFFHKHGQFEGQVPDLAAAMNSAKRLHALATAPMWMPKD